MCIFHDYKWKEIEGGRARYYNLMGGSAIYAKMKGTCTDCGMIKSKLSRL